MLTGANQNSLAYYVVIKSANGRMVSNLHVLNATIKTDTITSAFNLMSSTVMFLRIQLYEFKILAYQSTVLSASPKRLADFCCKTYAHA